MLPRISLGLSIPLTEKSLQKAGFEPQQAPKRKRSNGDKRKLVVGTPQARLSANLHKFEKRSPFEKSLKWLSHIGLPSGDEKEEKQVVFFDQLLHKVWTELAAKSPTRKRNPKAGPPRIKKLSSYDKA